MPAPTAEMIKEVTQLVKLGVPPVVAAMSKGASEAEFCVWMEKGAQKGKGNALYVKFFEAVQQAEGEAEAILIGRIRSSASENWSAAAWLAERRWPERYVRRSVTTKEQEREDAAGGDPFADVDNVMPLPTRSAKK